MENHTSPTRIAGNATCIEADLLAALGVTAGETAPLLSNL